MTARQLLSILRLSQAIARLRFSDTVAREDVDEAIRLTHMSKASLSDESPQRGMTTADGTTTAGTNGERGGGGGGNEDVATNIFAILNDYAKNSGAATMDIKLCEGMVQRKGYTPEQLQACLEQYEELDLLQISESGSEVIFL